MFEKLERYRSSINVPRKYSKRKRKAIDMIPSLPLINDLETAWDRNPGRDKHLQLCLDQFQERFGLNNYSEVISKLKEQCQFTFINPIWIKNRLNRLDATCQERARVMTAIKDILHPNRKRKRRRKQ